MTDNLITPSEGLALDVGCGVGVHFIDLAQKDYEVICSDISISCIRSAARLVTMHGLLAQKCILQFAMQGIFHFSDNKVDRVSLPEVVEH